MENKNQDNINKEEVISQDASIVEKKTKYNFRKRLSQFFTESSIGVGKYMVGKTITSLIIGVVSFGIFKLLNINLAWLLGLFLGLFNLVPMFGGWIGIILCAITVVFFDPVYIIYTTVTALVLQLTEQFFLLPLLVGKAIDLKPMFIVLIITIASFALGFWGVLLAIPVAIIIKVGYKVFINKNPD